VHKEAQAANGNRSEYQTRQALLRHGFEDQRGGAPFTRIQSCVHASLLLCESEYHTQCSRLLDDASHDKTCAWPSTSLPAA
jgi:hypothetical protein